MKIKDGTQVRVFMKDTPSYTEWVLFRNELHKGPFRWRGQGANGEWITIPRKIVLHTIHSEIPPE